MKTITRKFNRISDAERYLIKLCNKYEYAKLTECPKFRESGYYSFDVHNEITK